MCFTNIAIKLFLWNIVFILQHLREILMKRAAEIENILPAKRPRICKSDNVQALCDAIIANDEPQIGEILQKISFTTVNNKGFNAFMLVGMQADDDTCVKVINKYKPNYELINNITNGVAYSGRKKLLEDILNIIQATNIAPNYNRIAAAAAKGGYLELLEYILSIMPDNIAPYYNIIAANAAQGGHRELLEHILSIMPDNIVPNYNIIAANAARLSRVIRAYFKHYAR
jgi:hypothetical protein